MRVIILVVSILSAVQSFSQITPQQEAKPLPVVTLAVTPGSVTVAGCTPRGQVLLVSAAKMVRNGLNANETTPQVVAADASGRFTFATKVPLRSVWLAVDLETGAYATGARPGVPLIVAPIPGTRFRKDATNEIAELDAMHNRNYLVLVRPGKGAWSLRVRRGSSKDRNTANGQARIGFEDAIPVGTTDDKAPKHLKNDDFVALFDLGHLTLHIGTVGK